MRMRTTFTLASAILLLAGCDAATQVEEAELETGTETMTVAETEPADTWEDDATGATVFHEARLADLDTDGDRQVAREEYDTWFDERVWNEWDSDADDQVSRDDLGEVVWGWWDTDGDGFVDEREYTVGRETFTFEGVDYADFGEVAGDDDRWDRNEFDPWFEETLWVTWDTDSDQQLGRQDAADAFWQWWDEDGDDRVDAEEIARFGDEASATTAARTDEGAMDLGAR